MHPSSDTQQSPAPQPGLPPERPAPPPDGSEQPAPHRFDFEQPDFQRQHPQPPQRHGRSGSGRKWAIIVACIVLLAAGGAAAYFIFLKPDPASPNPTPAANPTDTSNAPAAQPDTSSPTDASTLKSTKLNLEVTKPAGWQGSEDPSSGELTLTSPSATYATAAGGSKTGVFVLKIRQGADADGQTAIRGSNAVQDSETIAYTAPTDNQRHYTNITVAGQGENASFVVLTSADQFKKGEALARFFINGDVYIVVGGFRDATKTGLGGFDLMTRSAFTGSEEYEAAVGTIKSLKIL